MILSTVTKIAWVSGLFLIVFMLAPWIPPHVAVLGWLGIFFLFTSVFLGYVQIRSVFEGGDADGEKDELQELKDSYVNGNIDIVEYEEEVQKLMEKNSKEDVEEPLRSER